MLYKQLQKKGEKIIAGFGAETTQRCSENGYPIGIYLFKIKNGNTRTMFEETRTICSKLTINTVSLVDFEQILHVAPLGTVCNLTVNTSTRIFIQELFAFFEKPLILLST